MMVTREIKTESDYRALVEDSFDQPVFLLKHSTTCGISKEAKKRFDDFCEKNDQVITGIILVIESRELSNLIADDSHIEHQSPQVILFRKGRAIWSRTHLEITQTDMDRALINI